MKKVSQATYHAFIARAHKQTGDIGMVRSRTVYEYRPPNTPRSKPRKSTRIHYCGKRIIARAYYTDGKATGYYISR